MNKRFSPEDDQSITERKVELSTTALLGTNTTQYSKEIYKYGVIIL